MRGVFDVFRRLIFVLAVVPLLAQPAFVFAQDGAEPTDGAEASAPSEADTESNVTTSEEEGSVESTTEAAPTEEVAELSGAKVAWMLTS